MLRFELTGVTRRKLLRVDSHREDSRVRKSNTGQGTDRVTATHGEDTSVAYQTDGEKLRFQRQQDTEPSYGK